MSAPFIETEHPRGQVGNAGQFREKQNDAPAGDLAPVHVNPLAQRFDTLEEKIDAMKEELAAGVAELANDENWLRHLDVMRQFHQYSFQNQILISIQRPNATRVAGFKVWKGLGRNVMKGEKGIAILAPKVINRRNKETGEPELDANGKPIRAVVGFTSATVFDVSQTDGDALPEVYQELSEEPPAGYIDDLEAAITANGYRVEYRKTGSAALGFTRPNEKLVVIDPDLSPGTRATTLAHELGHIECGHMDRLDEYHTGHGGCRGEMEVQAESFSYVLSQMNGMKTNLRPASEYVAGWGSHNTDALRKVGDTLQKAVKGAVGRVKWQNQEA
ncbi:MAG: ImmA/IrrE family metallo-endopeptidase [Microbacterium sp.]|uniref:ArdC-like ssDNA-binding domain-containing protein n=1 Tax=Microbacterium sp. TaxID=51671 RepID=UPI001AC644AC|nr:ArdC-like ssDNA-binding domain-containing protein [Microbacterium sp.]MBN9214657.1 ImmA/IrrE family metallo-endopeptidase [Microbacterium sp.]